MKLISITIGGFKNLADTTLLLDRITAVVSPNNYGKSNLLEALDFATDFMPSNPKSRKAMMAWTRGIPINPVLSSREFKFEIVFDAPELGDYRFVKYGFSFMWYRDDGSGQRITDEWLEIRPSESVRYTSFLKRKEGKYRKSKDTSSYRNILLNDYQLSIDILSAFNDIDIYPVINLVKNIKYSFCSSLDLGDRFQSAPIEYAESIDDNSISFDDEDVPRALCKLKQLYPDKYELFKESIFALFPEFIDINLQTLETKNELPNTMLEFRLSEEANELNTVVSEQKLPFKIREELYRLVITSENLNQPINMTMMSTGTKRIFWLLANIFIGSCNGLSAIGVDELETSIHPRLLKCLLEVLDEHLETTNLIISSHSPYLIQYLKPDRLYIALPNEVGVAEFKRIAPSKIKSFTSMARDYGVSVGEYVFELMSGYGHTARNLSFYLEE